MGLRRRELRLKQAFGSFSRKLVGEFFVITHQHPLRIVAREIHFYPLARIEFYRNRVVLHGMLAGSFELEAVQSAV